ncbi:MAG: lanthionine synthetase LanC family protein [Stenotrophomonas rhizophila]|uniref:lanthionine synthetase LanC family protein n=1 Tax=Stenotrophomonas rhizophila TaxID=216778 RepID=UPI003D0C34B7
MEENIINAGADFADALALLRDQSSFGMTPFVGNGLSLRAVIDSIQAERTYDPNHWQRMQQSLEEALALQDDLPLSSSLYRGMPGIAWAIQLCPPLLEKATSAQLLTELDEILVEGIVDARNPNLDLINGIAGIMIYAMRRNNFSGSSKVLWDSIESICVRSVREWLGLVPSKLEMHGTVFQNNLGVAHGMPGLLTVMVSAFRNGRISREAAALAIDGFEHLWTHSIKDENGYRLFPGTVGSSHSTRLAWCYGALGLVDAYINASSLEQANASRASDLVRGALHQLNSGRHRIMDASLCHGWAGAHFYFDVFSRFANFGEDLQYRCKSASALAGDEINHLNVGTASAPSYLRYSSGKTFKDSSFLSGTSGVLMAQATVASGAERTSWVELLGSFQPNGC